jgi:hypothetical protein
MILEYKHLKTGTGVLTWAGSPLLRQPGGPLLPGGHHIDSELGADTQLAYHTAAQSS